MRWMVGRETPGKRGERALVDAEQGARGAQSGRRTDHGRLVRLQHLAAFEQAMQFQCYAC
jgi:hypothetical protein